MIKDNIIGFFGFVLLGGFSLLNFLDQVRPVLGILGLVISLAVGISILWLNITKIKKTRLDKKINEMIYQHHKEKSGEETDLKP